MSTEAEKEKDKWVQRAAAADGGRGLALEEYDPDDPDDMKLLYEALKEFNPNARKRLMAFIRSKRQKQADAAPPKRLRLELSPNVGEALQQVTGFADEFDKSGGRMGDPCIPFEVAETWKEDDLATLLRQKTDACFANVLKQNGSNRSEEENDSVHYGREEEKGTTTTTTTTNDTSSTSPMEGETTTTTGGTTADNSLTEPLLNDNDRQGESKSPDTQRRALIVAIRAGMGNGKTHALRQAARLLGARGIYITYNGEQGISRDIEGAAKCVLLRITFALLGKDNYGAARFLDDAEMHTLWTSHSKDYLLKLTAHVAATVLRNGRESHLCICVDELRKLKKGGDNSEIRDLLSTLGKFVRSLYRLKPPIRCSVLVSALTDSSIKTSSERALNRMQLPPVDETVIRHCNRVLRNLDEVDWRVGSVAGYHMRSIVVGVDILSRGHSHLELPALMNRVYDRLDHTVNDKQAIKVFEHVKSSCAGGVSGKGDDEVQEVAATNASIPPAIMVTCLRKTEHKVTTALNRPSARAQAIFADMTVRPTPKQLEAAGLQYDLLRSIWRLKVVPTGMNVQNNEEGLTLFEEMKFTCRLEVDRSDLFVRRGSGRNQKTLWAGLVPKIGKYYHPKTDNHPWVDRFFVATDGSANSPKCLVLYQDKVNKSSFGDAVKDLNKAASVLAEHQETRGFQVLCIANVIGAGEGTKAQSNFTVPYILVRDHEVDSFYTVHFAPAIKHLRKKWLKELARDIDDVEIEMEESEMEGEAVE